MSRIPLTVLVLVSLIGCSAVSPSQPLVIAPTAQDWEAAFSRLRPEEQSSIRNGARIIAVPHVIWGGNIYSFKYGPPSGHPLGDERLNLSAICDGYNERFAARSAKTWELLAATTSVQNLASEGGTETSTFGLNWEFSRGGHSFTVSAQDAGPGVKIIWGASPEAIAAEANQAFALTFLELMLNLGQVESGG